MHVYLLLPLFYPQIDPFLKKEKKISRQRKKKVREGISILKTFQLKVLGVEMNVVLIQTPFKLTDR